MCCYRSLSRCRPYLPDLYTAECNLGKELHDPENSTVVGPVLSRMYTAIRSMNLAMEEVYTLLNQSDGLSQVAGLATLVSLRR